MNESIDNVLVLKIGSNTLTKQETDGTYALDSEAFQRIGRQVLELESSGTDTVLVSSAGITAGMAVKGWLTRPDTRSGMQDLQYLASVGWRALLNEWDTALPGKDVAGLLLTGHELPEERREALEVIHRTLRYGDVPIINENDAIAHEEIAFGDNDMLAAEVASRIARSALFGSNVRLMLLTDVDGVYNGWRKRGELISEIYDFEDSMHLAGGSDSPLSKGGMHSKFQAARIAAQNGIETWIANGRRDNVIQDALEGRTGTKFGLLEYAS
jgi:glutamate 5-kinase